jgi:hypothetical protein
VRRCPRTSAVSTVSGEPLTTSRSLDQSGATTSSGVGAAMTCRSGVAAACAAACEAASKTPLRKVAGVDAPLPSSTAARVPR